MRTHYFTSIVTAMLFAFVLVANVHGAGSAPPTAVSVVNTSANPVPVAVQGTASVTGSVTVGNPGTSPVPATVLNGPSQPVPVSFPNTPSVNIANQPSVTLANAVVPAQILNQDPRRGIMFSTSGTLSDNELGGGFFLLDPNNSSQPYTVPAGQRLIVEFMSAQCDGPTGAGGGGVTVSVGEAGSPWLYTLSVPLAVSNGFSDLLAVAAPLRAYINAGHNVQLAIDRGTSNGAMTCFLALAGFTVDMN